MKLSELTALSDALMDGADAADKPAVLIAQYDALRDERVFRWSCDDRSIGFRASEWPVSNRGLGELLRTWREAPKEPGSTLATAEEAKTLGPESRVLWMNLSGGPA